MSVLSNLGGVTLNNNMLWEDRWAWAGAARTVTRTLGGNLVAFHSSLVRGQPITLTAVEDQGWLNLSQVTALYALAQVPSATYTLELVQLGDELLAAPSFDASTGWTPTAPWVIAAGRASIDGSQGGTAALTAANVIARDGSDYYVEYLLESGTAGTLIASIPGAAGAGLSPVTRAAQELTADSGGGTGDLVLTADVSLSASLAWVSVRKVIRQTYTVQFRHEEAPAFNAVPLIPRQLARAADYFTATIKLMTV